MSPQGAKPRALRRCHFCGAMRAAPRRLLRPRGLPISVQYLRLRLDIGSDPRTLHLAVYQECNKDDGSESATAGRDKTPAVAARSGQTRTSDVGDAPVSTTNGRPDLKS